LSTHSPQARPQRRLPLVTLYVTERCNSRCVTCDYWRHGHSEMNLESITRLLPSLAQLGTRVVVLSGGEPLLHRQWAAIAELLKSNGLEVWLLTSGLALAKHARRAAELIHSLTVSLDGADRETYAAIRGLDAFDPVCAGISAAAGHGLRPSLRVTLQRANFRQLPGFVELARTLGARQVSFLAVDIANAHAFGRTQGFGSGLALESSDLADFASLVNSLERDHAADFRSGFIAESPQKLRRILQYFTAVNGRAPYPPVRCNAPEFSAVVGANGHVQPCFFIPGPPADAGHDPLGALMSDAMAALRSDIRGGRRAECRTCVCTMWRNPATDSFRASPGCSPLAAGVSI
jgi:MoaA/NifB/PqqE/SkfB family radical SAM enzyme